MSDHATTLDARDVQDLVGRIHRDDQDLDEGDLCHRIWRFRRYELKRVSIAELDLEQWQIDDALVTRLAAMDPTTMPPIVFDPLDRTIIDRSHRANARARCGDTEILAYVGIADSVDPDWTREPDEDSND